MKTTTCKTCHNQLVLADGMPEMSAGSWQHANACGEPHPARPSFEDVRTVGGRVAGRMARYRSE